MRVRALLFCSELWACMMLHCGASASCCLVHAGLCRCTTVTVAVYMNISWPLVRVLRRIDGTLVLNRFVFYLSVQLSEITPIQKKL